MKNNLSKTNKNDMKIQLLNVVDNTLIVVVFFH